VSNAVSALAGFRSAFCNYPGSLGFGQEFVDELAPRLGTLEVDAVLATKHHLEKLGLANSGHKKNVYIGGSHGGWIGSILTSRYVEEFGACVMRNPVVDLPSMLASTDIPDWWAFIPSTRLSHTSTDCDIF
jgi:acylaminoacyl-peptidase